MVALLGITPVICKILDDQKLGIVYPNLCVIYVGPTIRGATSSVVLVYGRMFHWVNVNELDLRCVYTP